MKTIEIKANEFSQRLVTVTTALTPAFLIISILLLALFNGFLEYLHYAEIIGTWSAIVPGLVFAILRFGSGLGGIKMIQNQEVPRGTFFVFVSIGLTAWATSHASEISQSIAINSDQLANAKWFVITALWVALLGELMIAAYMQSVQEKINKELKMATIRKRPSTKLPQQVKQTETSSNLNAIGFKTNSQQLVADLQRAKNNLAAYESKVRNGVGNADKMQQGAERWRNKVTLIEQALNS
tara:strand:- start:1684 stop:2403 length:720 start_codon:yes stop_codon:yes gene_type:complete